MFPLNYSTVVDPLLRDVRVCVAELSGMKADDRILDVCCGTGDQVFHYAKKGMIATGVDQNPIMINLAEANQKRHGFNDVTFCLAPANQLPFPDGYFDAASISLGLHEMKREKRDSAISEMKRVVKLGGIMIFTDFRVPLPRNPAAYLIKAVEFLVGKDNRRNFKDYLEQGGLSVILKHNQLVVQKEVVLKLRLLLAARATNPLIIA